MSLKGKRIVITGGSSGIGLAVAKVMAHDEGANVIIASRSINKLRKARAALGDGVEMRELDVTDAESIRNFFAELGTIDHLVTAASAVVMGPALDMPMVAFRELVESKLFGQFLVARQAISNLAERGSITFFSGTVTQKPLPGSTGYAAVGAAAEAMTRVLALEWAPRRVNTVVPGIIDTPAWDALFDTQTKPDVLSQIASSLPVKRIGTPDDIAQAVLFLIRNEFVDGTALVVDGGHRLI